LHAIDKLVFCTQNTGIQTMIGKLRLSVAVGDYDRTRPLPEGQVQIDGAEPVFMTVSPEEMFFRAFPHEEFGISELSFSSCAVKTAEGSCPYIAIPVFLSRAFRRPAAPRRAIESRA
jgi:4,5-dihydroxyphthalate decarboxylase